ncbi:MAG: 1-deoxy-D-xylulose-5-phosphate reductoisomerase [Bacteroidales bacterium]|jgi:1-deoxy-D-xylulose-5-phosphate reductoisomerase|nr:1-deoxy-D-xylulose-5-phosphate reductoisomerase [Bacteroidales bacterium]
MEPNPKRRIAILGSTGSIGTQALDVIGQHSDLFEVELLTANNNAGLLIEQARRFNPSSVVICNPALYDEVAAALDPLYIKVFTGIDSICDLVAGDAVDMVLTAMVGFSGLRPTLAAIKAGKAIALANKETLVAAGATVIRLARQYGAPILPVDSEHSAIFQCLQGEHATLEKILLTGSGGPFLHSTHEELAAATREQALNHPRWKMGAKVTVDSASLMNKGLELIEARWLFNVDPKDIEVVIHPQSIVHSMVQFSDGCVMAQLSQPDMRLPIQYALSYPRRIDLNTQRLDFAGLSRLTFEKPDTERFPCLRLAYEALDKGGNATCILNGANEVAVAAFLEGRIRFIEIPQVIDGTMSRCPFIENPDIDQIYSTDFEAKRIASDIVNRIAN